MRLVSGRPLAIFLSPLLGPLRFRRPLPLRLTTLRGLDGFLVDMSSLYQETRNQRTRNADCTDSHEQTYEGCGVRPDVGRL